jgi:hypothetical protein
MTGGRRRETPGGRPAPAGGAGRGTAAIDRWVQLADGAAPQERYRPRAPHRFQGAGPLHEVTATRVDAAGGAHWHLVTYGLSELDGKESDDPTVSGWGFELTLRLAGDDEPPLWAVDLLTNLAAYVWASQHPFAPGHHLDLGGPIKLDTASAVRAGVVVRDPGLGTLAGPLGSVEFLQVVGLTADELELCRAWSTEGVVELLARSDPLLVTAVDRTSVLGDAEVASEVRRRAAADGSSLTELRVGTLRSYRRLRRTVVEMGAGTASALGPALRRELVGPGATFRVVGDHLEVRLAIADDATWSAGEARVDVGVPLDEVDGLADLFDGRTGSGRRRAWPGLGWRVVP